MIKIFLHSLLFCLIIAQTQIIAQTVTIEGTIRLDRNWTELTTGVTLGESGSLGVASRIVFEGTAQSILTSNASSLYHNFEVNKTAAATPAKYLRLATNATLRNDLVLTAGIVNLNAMSLTINNSAATAITFANGTGIFAETAASSIDPLGGVPGPGYGYVRWRISNTVGDFVVPFVNSAGVDVRLRYNVTVAGNAAGQINFSTYGTPNNNKPWATDVTQFDAGGADGSAKVANRYYVVEMGSYTTKPRGWLTFKYLTTELDAGITENRLGAQRFNLGRASWGDWLYSPTANTGTKTVSIFMANAPDYYDSWVLSDQGNPLPIELVSFEAKPNGTQVDLNWTTAAEVNSDYFTIEKTADGVTFEEVVQMKAAGFSNNYLNYTTTDFTPYAGTSYYRLKNTDLDGQFELSELVPVQFFKSGSSSERSIEIFPNPNKGDIFNLELKGFQSQEPVLVVVQDMAGRTFYSKVTFAENEKYIKLIENATNLSSGVYLVIASSQNNIYSKKMVVE